MYNIYNIYTRKIEVIRRGRGGHGATTHATVTRLKNEIQLRTELKIVGRTRKFIFSLL